jgi:hypothetical protein
MVGGETTHTTSEWAIYDGRINANLSSISRSTNYSTSLSDIDKKYVTEIRLWSDKFFREHSCKIFWKFDKIIII